MHQHRKAVAVARVQADWRPLALAMLLMAAALLSAAV
jgi:hypothetical protein